MPWAAASSSTASNACSAVSFCTPGAGCTETQGASGSCAGDCGGRSVAWAAWQLGSACQQAEGPPNAGGAALHRAAATHAQRTQRPPRPAPPSSPVPAPQSQLRSPSACLGRQLPVHGVQEGRAHAGPHGVGPHPPHPQPQRRRALKQRGQVAVQARGAAGGPAQRLAGAEGGGRRAGGRGGPAQAGARRRGSAGPRLSQRTLPGVPPRRIRAPSARVPPAAR